jgi:hypothetical protein
VQTVRPEDQDEINLYLNPDLIVEAVERLAARRSQCWVWVTEVLQEIQEALGLPSSLSADVRDRLLGQIRAVIASQEGYKHAQGG